MTPDVSQLCAPGEHSGFPPNVWPLAFLVMSIFVGFIVALWRQVSHHSAQIAFLSGQVQQRTATTQGRPWSPKDAAFLNRQGLGQAYSKNEYGDEVRPTAANNKEFSPAQVTSYTSFNGWESVPAIGQASRDGLLLCTSQFNTDMAGYTSNVQRFFDSRRDKYGQGTNTTMMPVMEGESYHIQGASAVWFMGFRKMTVNQSQVVVPSVDIEFL